MSRAPFEPVGDRPRWELVHDELRTLDIGDTLTYERLCELLDVEDRDAVRQPVYKAAERWGAERKRALRAVPNVGYRVVHTTEHEALAKGQHRKSRRALKRGRTILRNADRSLLDPEMRERFDAMELQIGRQQDMLRRLNWRTAKVEKAVRDVQAESMREHSATAERIAALEDALHRHGINAAPELEAAG